MVTRFFERGLPLSSKTNLTWCSWLRPLQRFPKQLFIDFPRGPFGNLIEKSFSAGNEVVLPPRSDFVRPKYLFDRNCGCVSMKLSPVVLLFRILLLVLCLSNKLRAQTTTSGGLTGVVTDPSGAVVPDADVEIRDIAKGATQEAKTDREGVYRFFFLAPGRYTLTVSREGFRNESRNKTQSPIRWISVS